MLPNVPTSNEAGLPEFQASAWNGLFAPKATPKPILERLAGALDKALDDANMRKRLQELGSDIPDKASGGEFSFGEYPQIVRLAHFYQIHLKIIIEYQAALDKLVQIGPRYPDGPLQFIEQCFNRFLVEA
jgi:hypothetical protein